MRAGLNRGVGLAIVWGSFSMARQNSCYSHTGAEMRVIYESTGAVSRMQQVKELPKRMNARPWSQYEVSRSSERAGSYPKDKKCGSLAVIYATLGCSAGSCLDSCGEIKLTLNNTGAKRPPTSVATFCEHLCQQNAARQFGRSEVSFNSRRQVAESKLGKQVRPHSL